MSQELTFNFDELTIGDLIDLLQAAANNDTAKMVSIADRAIVGGLKHLPVSVFHAAMRQFGTSFAAYMKRFAEESPVALWMIRQALGDDKEEQL